MQTKEEKGKTYAKLKDLSLWINNPRNVEEKDLTRLKKQITELGLYKPLLSTPDGEILGGNKELQNGKNSSTFLWDIYMGRRKTDDLNLLCRVCNSLHYLELKYGKLPLKIVWN